MSFLKTYKKNIQISAVIWMMCMIAFALSYFFVIMPQNHSKKVLNKELEKKKQEYQSAQNAAKEETKKKALEEIDKLREKLDDFTIDFRNSSNLTFLIGQIARENNVNSLNIINKNNPVIPKANESAKVIENHLELRFRANFSQFAAFLNQLERSEPVLFVNKFTIIRSDLKDELCNITMDIASFIRTQQENDNTNKYSEIVSKDENSSKG